MKKIEFLVQGSAKEPYKVEFFKEDNNLTAHCSCPAGIKKQYCKHRFSILNGDIDAIVSDNAKEVEEVSLWLDGSDVEIAMKEVRILEVEAERIKKELSKSKKALASAMYN